MTGTFRKLYRALGPLAGGILLDTLDLATFGPLGLYVGWMVGLLVGWWIASIHEFGSIGKALFAALAAVYLTMPMTELFPVATLVSAAARFRGKNDSS
ncbi:MAG: hypothetical protein ACYTEP_09925 [Planctomycetota bacterium]|jgi:hypothetical protein